MDIYIYYWGQFGHENLYPEHVFDWSLKVVNCPTEDYSVGGVSNQVFTFTSDLKLDLSLNGLLEINGCISYVAAYEHINNADRWKYTCIPSGLTRSYYDEWDSIIPDLTLEQCAQRTMTLNDLFHELCWGYTDRDLNNLTVNPNYIINTNFGYSGITRRQVMQWVMQLTGGNIPFTQYVELVTNALQPIYRGGTSRKLLLNPSNVKNIQISDFEVPQIDKIWFGTDASDVGLSYGTGKQQLSLPYNPLINPDDDSFLQPLYDSIRSNIPAYTPMKVELFINEQYQYEENGQTTTTNFNSISGAMDLLSGHSSTYTTGDQLCIEYDDGTNVYTGLVFNYEFSPSGITLECTGNPTRELSNSLISNEIASAGKYNKFKRTLDETVSEIANLNGDVSTLTQTANSLTTQVAGKVGKDEVISSINQTAETITINANKINLVGAVTFSDLDSSTQNTINDKTSSYDVTTIIGNTVNAAYINALEINAKKIVATYTKTFNHSNYSSSDYITIQRLVRDKNWTAADLDRYDINMDGQITNADLIKVRNMVNNGTDETATIKTEIDPSKVGNPVAIYANGATTPAVYLNGSRVVGGAGIFNNIQANTVNAPYVYVTESGNSENYIYLYGSQIDFRKRNGNGDYLLGSISPASIVIDSGTTSTTTNYTSGSQSFSCWIDWDYRKWGDGTYECWGKANLYVASGQWANWGSVRSLQTLTPHLNYPVTFLSAPHEHVTACSSNDEWGFWVSAGANANCNNTTTTTARYQLIRGADGSINNYSSVPMGLEFYVKGKVSV